MGAVDDHGAFGVDHAGAGVVGVVGGDEGFFFVAEDSLQGTFGGCFEGGIDFVDGDFFFQLEDEVGEGGVEEGDPDGDAVEAAFEFWEDHGDGGGRPGGGGDEGIDGRAGAAEVFVGSVDDGLGVGEVMQSGEHTVFEAEGLVDHLDDGRDAVGCAGGVGDDVIGGGAVESVVAAHDDIEDTFFDGGGDDDFFDAGVEVGLQAFGVAEGAGAFEDDVDAGPVDFGRMVLGSVGESLAVDEDGVLGAGNIAIPAAVDGVEFEEVGCGFGVGFGIVEADKFEFGIIEGGAEDEATDTAKSVDGDFHRRFMMTGAGEGKRRSVNFF